MLMLDSKRPPDSLAGHFRWRVHVQLETRILTTALGRTAELWQPSYEVQSRPSAVGHVDHRTKTSTSRHPSTASRTGIRPSHCILNPYRTRVEAASREIIRQYLSALFCIYAWMGYHALTRLVRT
jgi:hypothetical protein